MNEKSAIVSARAATATGPALPGPKLRLLITSGMRNASIDLAAAREHGVTVCGTGSAKTPPTELTWALILGLARHLVVENAAFHSGGPWQSTVGVDLAGRTLGLVGFGRPAGLSGVRALCRTGHGGVVIPGPEPELEQARQARIAVGEARGQEGATPERGYQDKVPDEAAGGPTRSRMAGVLPAPALRH